MRWLALGGNGISDRAVNSLAEMLQGKTETEEDVEAKVCKLESLGLGGNAISDVGAKKIAQALRKNTSIKRRFEYAYIEITELFISAKVAWSG